MNQNIISNYNIILANRIFEWEFRGKEIHKSIDTNNIYLTNFLNDYNARWINENLLPDIEMALLDQNSEIENGSESVSIMIYHNRVELYDNDGFVYELPTQDFKEIVIGWRDFLLTPPLNGTKV